MKKVVLGILAHVDAGKTTLSEAMLYKSGTTRALGRVDKGDAYLDTFELEKQRGITIFSKQAEFNWENLQITLLDTPGHVDFSAEMERTLSVLDYAVLVISASDGVQGYTRTLWELLKHYKVPVFLFVNKMDMHIADKTYIMSEIKRELSDNIFDFSAEMNEMFYEDVAMSDEKLMESFLETGKVNSELIGCSIEKRKLFPCYFGSALKLQGVTEFLDGLSEFTTEKTYMSEFAARIFKISRDEQGNRLTHMKITGGVLKVKDVIDSSMEKVNQIRIYSGSKYSTVTELMAGNVCALTGLTTTYAGENLGALTNDNLALMEPVLMYRLVLPEGTDAAAMLPKLRIIQEEEPLLSVVWEEELKEIYVHIMGEVQLQVLKCIIQERFGVDVEFDHGNVVYKETIMNTVYGAGHYEPLRHYAEVRLKLEPGEPGSGLILTSECSEDILAKNWQRLIITHLEEKEHRGVLTGSPITDMKITVVGGRAHLKHTEGGDFRQATYRAVRQGLKMAESVLLEPYYDFRLEVPTVMLGRAMMDIERMFGKMNPVENQGDYSVISGKAPIVTMREYQQDVAAYTKGSGKLFCTFGGYLRCHNQDEIVAEKAYDSEKDLANPTGSVFCAHGAGFYVSYDMVEKYMHTDRSSDIANEDKIINPDIFEKRTIEQWMGVDEVDAIINKTYNANRKTDSDTRRNSWKKSHNEQDYFDYKASKVSNTSFCEKDNYLLVDGYNVIFAWEELSELAEVNIDGARGKLMDILCNYQAIRKCELILVFDAYRVKGHETEVTKYHNINVVYTKEAETADQYIEKFAHENGRKHNVTVATSDGLEQIIIRGQGCMLISSRELKTEIENVSKNVMEKIENNREELGNYIVIKDEI